MRAKIENMISSDYVLCYIPRALETLEKNENFVICNSEEAAAPLMSVAAPLWFWKVWKKVLDFGIFFPKL